MPPRKQLYDPQVQSEQPPPPELPPVRGIHAEVPGLYVSAKDAAALLARYAEQFHGEGRVALLAAAEVFADLDPSDAAGGLTEPPSAPPEVAAPEPEPTAVRWGYDEHPEIARVEIYPDVDGKWHARPVNETGAILAVTDGSFDRSWVEQDAATRWVGKEIFEVSDAMGDSIWDEQHKDFDARSAFTGRRRPSPQRLWAQSP